MYSEINTAKDLIMVATRELGLDKFQPKSFVENGLNVFAKSNKNDIVFRILLEFELDLNTTKKIEDLFFDKFAELRESILASPVIQHKLMDYSIKISQAETKIDALTKELEDCKQYKTYFEKQFLLNHGKQNENKTWSRRYNS